VNLTRIPTTNGCCSGDHVSLAESEKVSPAPAFTVRRCCDHRPLAVTPPPASQAHSAAENGSRHRAAAGERLEPVREVVARSPLHLYEALLERLEEASPVLDHRSALVDQALEVWARPGFETFICRPRLRFEPFPYQLEAAARVLLTCRAERSSPTRSGSARRSRQGSC
jgi:hypothetical protein